MGSCSSRPSLTLAARQSFHQQHAQMWVVQVRHVLEMTGTMKSHKSLKAQNLLEIWRSTMFTIFVSHQWLGLQHPDPNGEQLKVLQTVLKNLMAKRVTIDHDLVTEFYGDKKSGQLDGLQESYLWLDYFCVPQLVDGYPELAAEQLLYVKSIPSYVDLCNVFVILVPQALHHDTESACDLHSWLQRGWCRTELWCYYISTRSKLPVIEVKGPDAIRFTAPLWHRYQVHLGDFAVEMDRASCCGVIEAALLKHVAKLRRTNETAYRLYLSLFEGVIGLPRKLRSLDEFVSDFDFSKPLEQYKGLGPAACAALSGDEELLRRVVVAKASLDTHAPGMAETANARDYSPLHLVLWFRGHDLRMLETLLELRADANSSTINAPPPLFLCRSVEAVDLLVHHSAGVNFQGKFLFQYCPLCLAAGFGAPTEVLARLLELKADVRGGKGGMANSSPLHMLAYSGDSKNDLANAQFLLENGADINQVLKPEGFSRMLELMCRAYSRCRTKTALWVRFTSHISTTPLGHCALYENHGLLVFLLRARADPEIRGNTGLRPIDMARSETIRAILQDPTQATYLLERNSESVAETL